MGWRRRSGVLPLATLQDRRHGISGDLSTPNSHERTDYVASHVLQKTISTEHKDQALGVLSEP